jgi:hypothetical protein
MKKIAVALALCGLIAVPAYAIDFDIYVTDDIGGTTTYNVTFNGVQGQNYLLSGEATQGNPQDVDLVVNLTWGEGQMTRRPNDYWYGTSLAGFWGVPGSYHNIITNGGYSYGYSIDVGVPAAGATSVRGDARVK